MSRKLAALSVGVLLLSGCAGMGSGGSKPTALWIGDSYTAGAGGASTLDGEAFQVSAALNWHPHLDAEGGTGFVASGGTGSGYEPLTDRLSGDKAVFPAPSVVVVDAGRNDEYLPRRAVDKAAVSYFAKLASTYPSAVVVVIAPFFMTSKPGDFLPLRHLLARQAKRRGWAFVDPLADGWINAASAKLLSPDGVHPDAAGYDYLAAHLAPAITTALQAAGEKVG